MHNLFSIEARSYDIVGIASHNFWVLRDDMKGVLAELHGLATDRIKNTFKPIGIFKDRLGFYEFKRILNDPTFISTTQQSVVVYEGEKEDVFERWDKASSLIEGLNKKDLDYSPFGIFGMPITNSNSAYHLFARIMEIECCRFSGVFEPGIHNPLEMCLLEFHS